MFVCQNASSGSEAIAEFSSKASIWTEYHVPLPHGQYRIVLRAEGQMALLRIDHIFITRPESNGTGM
jgi:hypothetical protein